MSRPVTITVYRGFGWRWSLTASNGNIVSVSSEAYNRRRWALRGVEVTLGVKPETLQHIRPGQSKTIRRKYGDVTVRVESDG